MTKDLFVETIEQIEKQADYDYSFATNLSKVFPDAFQVDFLYKNYFLQEQIIKILKIEMGDKQDKESWIDYFIFELDFGNDYHDGCVVRKDGSNVDLSTPDKLYDFLMEGK